MFISYDDMGHDFEMLNSITFINSDSTKYKLNLRLVNGFKIEDGYAYIRFNIRNNILNFINWFLDKDVTNIEVCYKNAVNNSLTYKIEINKNSINFFEALYFELASEMTNFDIIIDDEIDDEDYLESEEDREIE